MKRQIFLAACFLPLLAHAAKPVKIIPGKEAALNGQGYRLYTVECSNGTKHALTSWSSGKQWCVGEASQDGCVKKQIKAAKTACKKD